MVHIERIRRLREDNHLTQKIVADRLGIAQHVYSNYESGQTRIPVDHLVILAHYYNCSLDYISGASSIHSSFPTA